MYLIAGLALLVWPLATLFFKRHVLDAQWLQMMALTLTGLSIIVFSCLFNNFLNHEYVLVLLWMILALTAPPLSGMAMASLTRQSGVSRKVRGHFFIAIIMTALLIISEIIAGKPIYMLWIQRSGEGTTHLFYPASWRYNLIVAVHHYLFTVVLIGELLFSAIYALVRIRNLHRLLGEYYTTNNKRRTIINTTYLCIFAICLMVALTVGLFPFNVDRPVWFVAVTCTLTLLAGFTHGGLCYMSNYGVERFSREHSIGRTGGDPARIGRTMCEYIEKEGFRNPDLTVFDLASRYKLSQDDVVDIIHRLHGMTFSDYVDSVRVECANNIIMTENPRLDDIETLSRLAHRCGYSTSEDLRHAMLIVLNVKI